MAAGRCRFSSRMSADALRKCSLTALSAGPGRHKYIKSDHELLDQVDCSVRGRPEQRGMILSSSDHRTHRAINARFAARTPDCMASGSSAERPEGRCDSDKGGVDNRFPRTSRGAGLKVTRGMHYAT